MEITYQEYQKAQQTIRLYEEQQGLIPVFECLCKKINLDKENTNINHFDYGLNAGIGLSIPLKKGFIDVNTRFYQGSKNATTYLDSKNQIVSYQLGYRFVL